MKLTQKWNSLFCFFLLTACGVGNLRNPNKAELLEAKDPSENGSRIEEFKMYDEPNHKVDPFCDLYTSLKIATNSEGVTLVALENKLAPGGGCEIALPPPNLRVYKINKIERLNEESGCVDTLLTGRGNVRGKPFEVKILDTRTNTCEIIKPASIILSEKREDSTNDIEPETIFSLN